MAFNGEDSRVYVNFREAFWKITLWFLKLRIKNYIKKLSKIYNSIKTTNWLNN
jgi:hypothetical protein